MVHTYVIDRLNRWALWLLWLRHTGADPGPAKVVSWWHKTIIRPKVQGQGGNRSPECPIDAAEAAETHACVEALTPVLRQAVMEYFTTKHTGDQQAEACGCCRATLYNRIDRAYAELLGMFNDCAAGLPGVASTVRLKSGLTQLDS